MGLIARARRLSVAALLLAFAALYGWDHDQRPPPERIVRDVTGLVRIPVERVVAPRTTAELAELMARHDGPISLGGGRFSMGGQIGTDGTLFVDLRDLHDVLAYDPAARTIRVGAGITWREIQERIDPDGLSLMIMQSYANFTVGGSLSVNAHGRYVGQGPLVGSVRSLDVVLADGSVVRCSRTENERLFRGVVGGYGALGVIAEVELALVANTRVERTVERIPAGDFLGWFDANVLPSDRAVFFNADLYPPDYDELVAITFSETDREPTVPDRLQTPGGSTAIDRFTYWWVSEAPLGKEARRDVIDRMRLSGRPVVWRNYEASYDVRGLEPGSREQTTYVLQEYFVPLDAFDAFVPKMAEVFRRYDVNVVNVSIRHATADPATLLTWAPVDVFAFVVYHKQGTADHDRTEVGIWTRELVEAVLSVGGTYYLPYQIHATPEQFRRAYPRADEFFALKREVDPAYELRNRLWDAYLPPPPPPADEAVIAARLRERASYARPEDQTLLTLPEWYIVYSADELGAWLRDHSQASFPFYASVAQFWEIYGAVRGSTRGRWPTNTGYHAMIAVIGTSYTAEYLVKGAWEGTVGRLTEAMGGSGTPEDAFYATVASDYGAFIHHTPWYAFPFGEKREQVGALPGSTWSIRGLERRGALWSELAAKAVWGGLMGMASQSAYGTETGVIEAWVRPGGVDPTAIPGITVLEELGPADVLLSLPRYEPFSAAVPALARQGVRFLEIAGGRTILVQVIAPAEWDRARLWGDVLVEWPILTEPGRKRVALEVPVRRLHEVVPALDAEPVRIEHVYDY